MLRSLTIALLITSAISTLLQRNPLESFPSATGKREPAAVIDNPDRKSAIEYGRFKTLPASTIEIRYAASGDLVCPRSDGQAQIVAANDVVVTSAHLFDMSFDCDSIDPISACRFYTTVDGVEQQHTFKAVLGTGHRCPIEKDVPAPDPLRDDWIVLRLDQAADERIRPYRVPAADHDTVRTPQDVVAVAKSDNWPEGDSGSIRNLTRHYADCDVKKARGNADWGYALTNCDMSAGSSGGAMLSPGEGPILLGIVRGELDPRTAPKCASAILSLIDDRGGYVEDCWAGAMILNQGVFRRTILNAVNLINGRRSR